MVLFSFLQFVFVFGKFSIISLLVFSVKERHDIAEILLKLALSTNQSINQLVLKMYRSMCAFKPDP